MKKRSLGLFLLVSFMVMGVWVVPAMSAYFTLDYTPGTGSFFFGQRGAGVAIEGIHGTTDFGHPTHNPSSPLAVDMYGAGKASQTVTQDLFVYEVGEHLVHSIEVEFLNSDTAVDIGLRASLSVEGMLPSTLNVAVTNDSWEGPSYADAWGKTVLAINGDDGEAVRVHIDSWVTSNTNGSFDTTVGLGGCYPENFSIWHNGVNIWDAGSKIYDPHGTILDNLIIDAVVGDTITLNAKVGATLSGTVWDEVFTGNYANVNFHAAVELEPDPDPVPFPDITVTDSVLPDDDLQVPFGDVTEGTSSDQTVTVTNDGNADLAVGNIAQADLLTAPFSILNDTCSGQTLIPVESCTLTVRFSPTTTGTFNDSFDIPSNDPDEDPVAMNVSGTGVGACEGDFDSDGDVDGSDLAELAADPGLLDLSSFAANFGRTDCP